MKKNSINNDEADTLNKTLDPGWGHPHQCGKANPDIKIGRVQNCGDVLLLLW